MTLWNKCCGVAFGILLFLSSFLGVLIMGGWAIPIHFLHPALYRLLLDKMMGWWLWFAPALIERFLGTKMVIHGDLVRPKERNLLLMNHRTRLDWMYLWSVLVRSSGVNTEKIILKAPLKKIPGAGWAMQCGAFLFINRNWEEDQQIFVQMLNYFAHLKHNTQIMIFPEGTDFTAKTKERSDAFAHKNNLEPYDYVLHPRTTGFTFLAQHMRSRDMLDAVYDITVAYPKTFPQNEPELIGGKFPEEVHFLVKRYDAKTIPPAEDSLQDWCRQVWKEKEETLKNFYKNRKFEGKAHERCHHAETYLTLALLYWCIFIVVAIWLLVHYLWARLYALAGIIFFFYMTYQGGWELYQSQNKASHVPEKQKIN